MFVVGLSMQVPTWKGTVLTTCMATVSSASPELLGAMSYPPVQGQGPTFPPGGV